MGGLSPGERRAGRSGQPSAATEPGSIVAGDRGWLRQQVAADLVQQLTALAGTAGLTLGVLTHAAWALVLSEQLDGEIEFGTSITGRSGEITDVEHLVGALARTVRVQVPRPPSGGRSDWLTWFGELRRALLEAEAAPAMIAASWCQRPVLAATVLAYENFPTLSRGRGEGWRATADSPALPAGADLAADAHDHPGTGRAVPRGDL